MAPPEVTCPICNADLPLAGDERPGDDLYCTYCGAPCVLTARGEGDFEAEEDF